VTILDKLKETNDTTEMARIVYTAMLDLGIKNVTAVLAEALGMSTYADKVNIRDVLMIVRIAHHRLKNDDHVQKGTGS
jgi:hypothetical protein